MGNDLLVMKWSYTYDQGKAPVVAHASNSYCVAGDSVHESWCLTFSIEEK